MGEGIDKQTILQRMEIPDQPSLYMRPMRLGDGEEYYRSLRDGGSNIERFMFFKDGTSPEKMESEAQRSVSEMEQGRMLRYEIFEEQGNTERMVGEVSLYEHNAQEHTSKFGYHVTSDLEGKGVAYAACRELLNYGIEKWGLKKIFLEIEPGNERSERLAQALSAHCTEETNELSEGDRSRSMRVWEIIL